MRERIRDTGGQADRAIECEQRDQNDLRQGKMVELGDRRGPAGERRDAQNRDDRDKQHKTASPAPFITAAIFAGNSFHNHVCILPSCTPCSAYLTTTATTNNNDNNGNGRLGGTAGGGAGAQCRGALFLPSFD